MDKHSKSFTRWLDGSASPSESAAFEADPLAQAERENWRSLREGLRRELSAPPLPHPDFVNTRVLEEIRREEARAAQRRPALLGRLAFLGAGSLAAAATLALLFLPGALREPTENEFISQVISARAGNPRVSVQAFQSPSDRGVVLWMEGAPFIPSTESVR